jgi:hypothetical protein
MKKSFGIIHGISIALVVIGFFEILMDRMFCRGICRSCSDLQLNPCFFLIMFVGIVFIVDGASLYLTYSKK